MYWNICQHMKAIQVQDYLFNLCGEVDVAAAVITVAKTTYWAILLKTKYILYIPARLRPNQSYRQGRQTCEQDSKTEDNLNSMVLASQCHTPF